MDTLLHVRIFALGAFCLFGIGRAAFAGSAAAALQPSHPVPAAVSSEKAAHPEPPGAENEVGSACKTVVLIDSIHVSENPARARVKGFKHECALCRGSIIAVKGATFDCMLRDCSKWARTPATAVRRSRRMPPNYDLHARRIREGALVLRAYKENGRLAVIPRRKSHESAALSQENNRFGLGSGSGARPSGRLRRGQPGFPASGPAFTRESSHRQGNPRCQLGRREDGLSGLRDRHPPRLEACWPAEQGPRRVVRCQREAHVFALRHGLHLRLEREDDSLDDPRLLAVR
ncbi:hypothetical protein Oter_4423 [Opitutus terrae PB90-1]|uniref:Uncharacterized protein n=1 Tax=Opitutus terrae (strain DSM 11246 / JCM 15787 / PB90-1) TaxID=452637 RepID=B1ZPX3_OPITP|nr:hypothetical protein Oter_4423 [Opitutus terrae PB90-1]